jgi:hypothetical protein
LNTQTCDGNKRRRVNAASAQVLMHMNRKPVVVKLERSAGRCVDDDQVLHPRAARVADHEMAGVEVNVLLRVDTSKSVKLC